MAIFNFLFYHILQIAKKKHLQTFKNCCLFSIKKNRLILPYTALPFRRWWRIVLKTKLQDRSISCAKDIITEPSSQICIFNIIRIGFLFVCLFAIQKQCAQEAGCQTVKGACFTTLTSNFIYGYNTILRSSQTSTGPSIPFSKDLS